MTIAKQNGYNVSIAKIRETAETDLYGTNIYGVLKAAEELGFNTKAVKGDKTAFFQEFPLPCIAHMVINGSMLHYVVIHKITEKEIIIADPAEGIVKLSPTEFFGESEENLVSKYCWTGIIVLIAKSIKLKKQRKTRSVR